MPTRYHITKRGTPGVCHAQEGGCPLNKTAEGEATHYYSRSDAWDAAERLEAERNGGVMAGATLSKKSSVKTPPAPAVNQTQIITPANTQVINDPSKTQVITPSKTQVINDPSKTQVITPDKTQVITPDKTQVITPDKTQVIRRNRSTASSSPRKSSPTQAEIMAKINRTDNAFLDASINMGKHYRQLREIKREFGEQSNTYKTAEIKYQRAVAQQQALLKNASFDAVVYGTRAMVEMSHPEQDYRDFNAREFLRQSAPRGDGQDRRRLETAVRRLNSYRVKNGLPEIDVNSVRGRRPDSQKSFDGTFGENKTPMTPPKFDARTVRASDPTVSFTVLGNKAYDVPLIEASALYDRDVNSTNTIPTVTPRRKRNLRGMVRGETEMVASSETRPTVESKSASEFYNSMSPEMKNAFDNFRKAQKRGASRDELLSLESDYLMARAKWSGPTGAGGRSYNSNAEGQENFLRRLRAEKNIAPREV